MLRKEKMVISKVPANDNEALKSNLMGLFEKKRVLNIYNFIGDLDPNDKKTWKDRPLETMPMSDIYKHYKLESNTIDFLGHAVALHPDDAYIN